MHKTAKRWYFVSKIYRTRPNFTKQLQISHKRWKNKQFSRNFLLSCHFSTPDKILASFVCFCQIQSTQKIFHQLYQYFGGNLSYLFVYFLCFQTQCLCLLWIFWKILQTFTVIRFVGAWAFIVRKNRAVVVSLESFFQKILNKHKD